MTKQECESKINELQYLIGKIGYHKGKNKYRVKILSFSCLSNDDMNYDTFCTFQILDTERKITDPLSLVLGTYDFE